MTTNLSIIENCNDCGLCCMQIRTPPFLGRDDPERKSLPVRLKVELELHYLRILSDSGLPDESPCVWLDLESKRCRNYEHRPEICREFEMGGEYCLEFRHSDGRM